MKGILKKILLLVITLTFFLSLNNVIFKYKTETSSDIVELAVDYKNVYGNAKKGAEDFEENIFDTLKQSGVTSIGYTENSLLEMESRELIHALSGSELEKNLWSQNHTIKIQKNYTYVLVPKSQAQDEIIDTIEKSYLGNTKKLQMNNTVIIEIDKRKSDIYKLPLLYLESDYNQLAKEFNIIPRISNSWGERYPIIEEQLKRWNEQKPLSSVVFLGNEVVGFNDEDEKIRVKTSEFFSAIGIGVIETFTNEDKQKGITNYASDSDYNIVRVHSLPKEKLENYEPLEMKRLISKAVKERNIRIIYVNPFPVKPEETEGEYLERLSDSIEPIVKGIKYSGMELKEANSFQQNKILLLNKLSALSGIIGSAALFLLAILSFITNRITNKYLSVLLGVILLGMPFVSLIGIESLLIKVVSLGLSILLPVWSSLHIMKVLDTNERMDFAHIAKKIVLPLAALYTIGISYLISMNYTIAHVVYMETFRGVGLTLTLPPIIVGLWLAFSLRKNISLKTLLFHNVRIIDILIVVVLLVFFVFYHSRSGNGGSMLPFEAMLRAWLEDVLPWRPRTKEVFFAFPLLVIVIAYWKRSKWVRVMLPFVTVGFASMFNTFTHFHTPMIASAGRSILAIVIGTVLGLIAWTILKICCNQISKRIKIK